MHQRQVVRYRGDRLENYRTREKERCYLSQGARDRRGSSIPFDSFHSARSAGERGGKEREPCRLNQETNEMLGNSRGCIDFTRPRVRERCAVHPPPLPGNSGAADTLSIISKFAPTDLEAARPRQFAGIPALPSRKFSG